MIRTLGLYQPYAQLMLHGKLESRWIAKGKKAPFPLGKYLLYATKKAYSVKEFKHLAGEHYERARLAISNEELKTSVALCVGDLIERKPITTFGDLADTFYDPPFDQLAYRDADHPEFEIDDYVLWGLRFNEVKPIKPFPFKGKQGVGFLSAENEAKIIYI